MKKILKDQHGFTLIEMMVVMTIISILLLILIPHMTKNSKVVSSKSCDATIRLLQAQVGVYEVDNGEKPTSISDLEPYIEGENTQCPDKSSLEIQDGIVQKREA